MTWFECYVWLIMILAVTCPVLLHAMTANFNTFLYSSAVFKRFGCHPKVASDASQKVNIPIIFIHCLFVHPYIHMQCFGARNMQLSLAIWSVFHFTVHSHNVICYLSSHSYSPNIYPCLRAMNRASNCDWFGISSCVVFQYAWLILQVKCNR